MRSWRTHGGHMPQQHGVVRTAQRPRGERGCDSCSTTCQVGRGTQEPRGSPKEKSQTQKNSPGLTAKKEDRAIRLRTAKDSRTVCHLSASCCVDSRQPCGRKRTDGESWAYCMKGHGMKRRKDSFWWSWCAQIDSAHLKLLTQIFQSAHL